MCASSANCSMKFKAAVLSCRAGTEGGSASSPNLQYSGTYHNATFTNSTAGHLRVFKTAWAAVAVSLPADSHVDSHRSNTAADGADGPARSASIF